VSYKSFVFDGGFQGFAETPRDHIGTDIFLAIRVQSRSLKVGDFFTLWDETCARYKNLEETLKERDQ